MAFTDYIEWQYKKDMAMGYEVGRYNLYDIADNSFLLTYYGFDKECIKSCFCQYMKRKTDKKFDTYVSILDGKYHILNVLPNNTVLFELIIEGEYYDDGNKRYTFSISPSLLITRTKEHVVYDELKEEYIVTDKIDEQIYQITDKGKLNHL